MFYTGNNYSGLVLCSYSTSPLYFRNDYATKRKGKKMEQETLNISNRNIDRLNDEALKLLNQYKEDDTYFYNFHIFTDNLDEYTTCAKRVLPSYIEDLKESGYIGYANSIKDLRNPSDVQYLVEIFERY